MSFTPPPKLSHWLLDRALGGGVRGASIRGDLFEELQRRTTRQSPAAARRWYRRQALAIAVRALLYRPSTYQPSQRKASVMDILTTEVRSGWRALKGARAFSATAIITLALGIGAATAVFAVVDAVLLRPLPLADPSRLMWLSETNRQGSHISLAWPDFLDWRAKLSSFQDLAAVRGKPLNWTGGPLARRVTARQVTSSFFQAVGVQPALGRAFTDADDHAGAARVVILADAFWRQQFGADPAAIGRTMTLDGQSSEIIGVLPRNFRYGVFTFDDLYKPLGEEANADSGMLDRGNHNGLVAIGRLRSGVTEATARHELDALNAALTATYPNTNSDTRAKLQPIADRLVGTIAPTLRMLFVAVGFLLLLAAVNVANLLVARGLSRQHELAVRAALGCSRWRLALQLLVESTFLGLAGAAAGLALATLLIKSLVASAPTNLPRLDQIGLTGHVALFALAVSLLSALLLVVFPALQAFGVRGSRVLVRTGRGDTASLSAQRLRRALMVVEVALAVVLLTGAGLMARTMAKLDAVQPGFDPSNLLTARFNYDGSGMGEANANERVRFLGDLLDRVRAVPGVIHAALTLSLPIEGSQWGSVFIVAGQPVPARPDLPSAAFTPISESLFETLGMHLTAGRAFTGTEVRSAGKVAVVNETFARHFWPNESAVGKRLKQGWPEDDTPWIDVIGVVNDVKLEGVDASTPMQVYLSVRQTPGQNMALVVKCGVPPGGLRSSIAAVFHDLRPDLPIYDVQTMDELMSGAVSRQRLSMLVLLGFSAVALVIACVGLAGIVAQSVTERTREIGVRLALGADRGRVLRMFVAQGLVTTVAGLAIGVPAALLLSRLIRDLLFEVTTNDPVAIAVVLATLPVVAVAACYFPARRASRVSPTVALRGD